MNTERVRGRPFAKKNPGRPPGSKNKSTVIAASLAGEQGEALLRKAIEMADDGNTVMMKFLLERYLPKGRIIPIQLPPIDSASDAIAAMTAIVAAVSAGSISPREAADLTLVVDTFVRSIEVAALERDVEILYRKLDPKKADLDKLYADELGEGTESQ